MFAVSREKGHLLSWSAWFLFGNIVFLWFIGLLYLPAIPWEGLYHHANLFLIFSYISHFSLIMLVPGMLFVPMIFLFPRITFFFAILITSMILSYLMVDAITYSVYQFHLNSTVLTLFYHGLTEDVLGLSWIEKISPFIILSFFILIESFYARWVWRRLARYSLSNHRLKWIFLFLATSVVITYSMLLLNLNPTMLRVYIQKVRFLPFYIELLSKVLPQKERNLVLFRINDENPLQHIKAMQTLKYPMHALNYTPVSSPLNLVMIVIDTWRFDMLNQEVTPFIKAFSEKAWVFDNHVSGGNSTGPGIFTLFYGLPATYTKAMEAQHKSPILLEALKANHYQMGIFSSAPLYSPPLDKTVFQNIEHNQLQRQSGDTVFERDYQVTEKFSDFLDHRDTQKPFFSFLFYDAAHSYCGADESIGPFQPTTKKCNRLLFNDKRDHALYFNRYKNAVFSIDQQVEQTISLLQKHDLLNNTIVMIIGDHGEEFNDAENGYLGHASNYTQYQIRTPFLLYWPDEKPATFSHQTSHFDVVATLMPKMLGCKNPALDYSVGTSLLNASDRPYFIISSYVDFGIVQPEQITTIFSTGQYQITASNGRVIPEKDIDIEMMREVFNDLHRFYDKKSVS